VDSGTAKLVSFKIPPSIKYEYRFSPAEVQSGSMECKTPIGGKRILGDVGDASRDPPAVSCVLQESANHLRGRLAAHALAELGDIRQLERLLSDTPQKLFASNRRGETAAHVAARCGQLEVIRFLLKAAPSLFRIEDHRGNRPSHHATALQNGQVKYKILFLKYSNL
jgi:hypothetical protein